MKEYDYRLLLDTEISEFNRELNASGREGYRLIHFSELKTEKSHFPLFAILERETDDD